MLLAVIVIIGLVVYVSSSIYCYRMISKYYYRDYKIFLRGWIQILTFFISLIPVINLGVVGRASVLPDEKEKYTFITILEGIGITFGSIGVLFIFGGWIPVVMLL